MTTKIAKVANVALQVFNQHSSRINSTINSGILTHSTIANEKLNLLLNLLSKIDGKDVGFDESWVKNTTVKSDGSANVAAPVLYVHIMENEVFSLGIFVLRPGSRIPLHDHPNMYGLVKVIFGNVRCRSFSKVCGNNKPSIIKSFIPRLCKWQIDDLITAVPYQDTVLDCKSDSMLLTPSNGNFHELITVGNEGAAFVDILAPPYDHLLGKRECHFYQEISIPRNIPRSMPNMSNGSIYQSDNDILVNQTNNHNINSSQYNSQLNNVQNNNRHIGSAVSSANQTMSAVKNDDSSQQFVYLAETHQPKDYWCDSAEYRGPRVL